MWDNTTSYDAIFVIVTSCGGVLLYQLVLMWARYRRMSRWSCVSGEVSELDARTQRASYVYRVGSGRFRGSRHTATDSFVIYREALPGLRPGDAVKVYVSPTNARLALLRTTPDSRVLGLHALAAVVCGLIATTIVDRVGSAAVLGGASAVIVFAAAVSEFTRYGRLRSEPIVG